MENYELAATVLLLSIGIGLLSSITINPSDLTQSNNQPKEVHEHALFHVIVNGTEIDFTKQKYQLNSYSVHLENNKSDIVHKHRTQVTWREFLNSINTTTWRSNSTGNLCLNTFNQTDCGKGNIYLNDGINSELDKEINQGDHLLIVIDSENQSSIVDEYLKQQLPPEYKPRAIRGKRI